MVKDTQQDNNKKPEIIQTVAELRAFVSAKRLQRRRIAMVPTMGALHDGHMELVRVGRGLADDVIASIFVNPAQFGPNEDFAAYPRTWDADLAKLAEEGAAAVFYPAVAEMYPDGFSTNITLKGVTAPLEGAARPGHFDGVATVVCKLLLQCMPDVALFGEKDWQQLQVITRMVVDLNIPVAVRGVPTVRDENGLALSSRNAYLSAEQYQVAITLNKTMSAMAARVRAGEDIAAVEAWGAAEVLRAGFDSVDYLTVRDAATLEAPGAGAMRILAAVRLGRARLIDNIAV
ncbi:MAG: pantoate--beta-alanine ligase [Alphaproteobacteria bacterium]|nr:pantoate--beta-alanine ligase [Alphaproteobacteria bacterium]